MSVLDQSRFSKKEKIKIVSCGLILSALFLYFLVDVVLHLFRVKSIWPVQSPRLVRYET